MGSNKNPLKTHNKNKNQTEQTLNYRVYDKQPTNSNLIHSKPITELLALQGNETKRSKINNHENNFYTK